MTQATLSPETVTRVELPNGIIVLAYENHASPSVVLSGYLWAGALSEAPGQDGLASFTASMLMRGTQDHTFGEINEALESVGAQLGFSSGMHTAGFGGKALAEDLDLLLHILAESLQSPTFPADESEKRQGQILTGLQRRAHDTRSMARLTFDALLYPDHPYGRSVQGYEETVSRLGRDDLVNYYRYYDQLQNLTLLMGIQLAEVVQVFDRFIDLQITPMIGLYLTGTGLVLLLIAGVGRLVVAYAMRSR